MTIQEILNEYRIDFLESGHHHCRAGWLQIRDCPFCNSDNYTLGWNIAANYSSCWRCGHHHADKLLAALEIGRERVLELLASVDTGLPRERERSRISLKIPPGIGPLLPAHRDYLRERGFNPAYIVWRWAVQGIGVSARLGWRLYIPIFKQGKQVSWTTRAIGSHAQPRYLSASADEESFNHRRLIYGMDFCRTSIVAVEGPIDAWRIGPGAGALFGITFLPAQVLLLAKFPRRYICLDSSPEAQVRARELVNQLAVFPGVTENIVLDAKDPGEASPREIRQLRRIAGLVSV
jgi:hypothetical protein